MIGAKLVRFSKVTRAIRIISVTRVIRIQEYLEHIGDRLHGGTSLKYVGEMGRLVLIIIWINHVMSCTWFYVGRVTEGDTGTSWLNDPIRDENSPLYHDTLPLFQYTTAFHWALTQMTPGSMQARPACDKGLTPCLREPCISIPPQCLDFLPGSEVPSPAAGLPQELAGASEPKPAGKSTSHATLCRAYRNLGLNIRSPNSFSSKHNFPQLEASDALTHGNFGYPSFPLPDCVLA
ncbi:Potassium voltage-gated channel subfamily H member 2 [Durusdinium trenchii]|uniref:Potassium voltage-gated channel subfamily H member 2 n=1 Tax=Durusdinium trenchii TaxID=1381693 RepID=A0ABP0PUE9_9DINO